jgi:hypothetical protein
MYKVPLWFDHSTSYRRFILLHSNRRSMQTVLLRFGTKYICFDVKKIQIQNLFELSRPVNSRDFEVTENSGALR